MSKKQVIKIGKVEDEPLRHEKVMRKVHYFHFRTKEGKAVSSVGGATVCYLPVNVPSSDGFYSVFGVTVCSTGDRFNKTIGRGVSYSDALGINGILQYSDYGCAPFGKNRVHKTLLTMHQAYKIAKQLVQEKVTYILARDCDKINERHDSEWAQYNKKDEMLSGMSDVFEMKIQPRLKAEKKLKKTKA